METEKLTLDSLDSTKIELAEARRSLGALFWTAFGRGPSVAGRRQALMGSGKAIDHEARDAKADGVDDGIVRMGGRARTRQ